MPKLKKQYFKNEIPNTPFRYFWFVSKPFKKYALTAITIVVIAAGLSQSSAYIFKLIVDAIEAGNSRAAFGYALFYPAVMFVIQLLYRLSGLVGRLWVTNATKYSYDVLSAHILRHSHRYFSDRFAGSLMSKMQNVNNGISNLIPDLLWHHLSALVSFAVTLGFLIIIDIKAASMFALLLVALVLYNRSAAPTKTQYSKENAEANTTYRARLVDTITNVQAVRQYSQTDFEQKGLANLSHGFRSAWNQNWAFTEKMLFWNGLILFVFSAAMFWFLVLGWQQGLTTTGEAILVLVLFSQITGTLIFIGRAFNSAAQMIGEVEEGLGELLLPHEIKDNKKAAALKVPKAEITWRNVKFNFAGKNVFNNFCLNIPSGQRLGLVGQSGAGKTTLVSLLLRQHDLNEGSIEIDNQNIAKVTQDSLRRAVAVVPQEPALFHRSIRENILYGNPDATEEEVIKVAKKAQAHEFIYQLPEGYDTFVGERGVKLSGGQKQRIAIARAMLKDAPILILDEATSALDSESEVAIQAALHKLMKGKTVIAVAHRLSTLREMNRIIVIENGKIIEDGTHQELVQKDGQYSALWAHQSGGFLE